MRQYEWRLGGTLSAMALLIAGLLSVPLAPMQAQFATNTPEAAASSAALTIETVTPAATSTLAEIGGFSAPTLAPILITTPNAPIDNYPLRQWFEQDMINLLFQQIAGLEDGGADARRALQITAFEMTFRFPGAPNAMQQREQLIQAALAAPRGAVDMRFLITPYIAAELNRRVPDASFEFNGFRIDITPARVNADETMDALLHILYPADADSEDEVLYESYLLATRSPEGAFNVLPAAFDLPAAPFGTIRSVSLQRLEDVNKDTLDEMVLLVDDGEANQRLYIVGFRNNMQADFAAPGQVMRLGSLISWDAPPDEIIPVLKVYQFKVESAAPDWECFSQIPADWVYTNNFYQPEIALNARYVLQDTLGCQLHAAEPLFGLAPDSAAAMIEQAIVTYSLDAPSADRALVTLAMLYALQGRRDEALAAAQAAIPAGEPDSWAAQQANTLIQALSASGNTQLDVCEALVAANPAPACDLDALLGRYLALASFTTDKDLTEQLTEGGFSVLESVLVAEIGKANRIVVSFTYQGSGWYGFAAQRDGTYIVEKAEAPIGFGAASQPENLVQAPEAAYEALLVNRDPQTALNIVNTIEQNNPNAVFSPALLYLRAVSYDLAANRQQARTAYFTLWQEFPRSLWGQLAAQHLERRG